MRVLVALVAVGLLSVACGAPEAAPQPAAPVPGAPGATGVRLSGGGTLAAPAPKALAVAYNARLAPPGASATLTAESGAVLATSTLTVGGLLPDRTYGAHLHVNPCGVKPEDAGPHYQHAHSHASADNEVWLDFTTDAHGAATTTAKQDWAFIPGRLPRSLVIHAKPTTKTGAEAGTAGPRVACVTLAER
ncbi:superoxide dismutase family protein [Streptosporangium roseum]|uniref:superoxide dismutase family protein n=1 Tax=Streptosporangium roseum TaxID=2001 RepID=UPI00068AA59E|nr:superoxide dismutase family protein [Streptosporangium roseum]